MERLERREREERLQRDREKREQVERERLERERVEARRVERAEYDYQAAVLSVEGVGGDERPPMGCENQKLVKYRPTVVRHDEDPPETVYGENRDGSVPYGLQLLLENTKKQYMAMMATMQTDAFRTDVEAQIEKEKDRKETLVKRDKQLRTQIEGLSELPVKSPEEIMALLQAGEAHRHYGNTSMNERSEKSSI